MIVNQLLVKISYVPGPVLSTVHVLISRSSCGPYELDIIIEESRSRE